MIMKTIRYGARQHGCTNLGPGSRAVIWVQGCCFQCEDCIAQAYTTDAVSPQITDAEEMADWVLSEANCDGLTISGGEPMLQAEALTDVLERIRIRRDVGVIVYTGFVYEELLERGQTDRRILDFLSRIDLLIDGPYRKELDINQPFQGSSNQRMICLTPRYKDAMETYYSAAKAREVEIRLSEGRLILIGIPSADQANMWREMKKLSEV